MRGSLALLPAALGVVVLLGIVASTVNAHHGGLGIEGDIIAWSLKVDQWQQEHFTNGYRIKFLAYPRNVIANRSTRLVFEVQSIATGRYVGGLTAEVIIRSPRGEEHQFAAPEVPGVTAYYELSYAFSTAGEHSIVFETRATGQDLTATFAQPVSANPLFGDWTTMVGNGAILAAFMATWIGAVLALQRRLLAGASLL
ncbi:MAG TPA: hypothetical protein VLK82_08290 [Candidatus Tectomicrobia bacterium]|nr:hypothetical protein [Candidatus Tectomicrobia bacterium]